MTYTIRMRAAKMRLDMARQAQIDCREQMYLVGCDWMKSEQRSAEEAAAWESYMLLNRLYNIAYAAACDANIECAMCS